MATYYVRTDGHDAASGLNNTNNITTGAKLTIGGASGGVSAATNPGDIVHIVAGAYTESVSNFSNGTIGNPIIIEGDGATTTWTSASSDKSSLTGAAVFLHNKRYIRFQNIKFQNSVTKATIYGLADAGAGNIGLEFRSCTFTNNGNKGYDLDATGGIARTLYMNRSGSLTNDNHVIDSCSFDLNYGLCLQAIGCDGFTVTNNTVTNQRASQYDINNNFSFSAEAWHFGSGGTGATITGNAINTFVKDGYIPASGGSCNGPGGVCQYATSGIKFDASAGGALIQDNVIHDVDVLDQGTGIGIFLESSVNNNTVKNNIIYNIGNDGVHMGSPPTSANTGNVLDGNTIYACLCNGIRWSHSTNGIQKNNIIYQTSTGPCCSVSDISSGITFNNNLYFRSSGTNVNGWLTTNAAQCSANRTFTNWNTSSGETNAKFADPTFVTNGTDFHLQQGSPGIGMGVGGINAGAYPNQTFSTPVISNVLISDANYNQFTITWTTDVASSSQVNYGLTSGYGSSTTLDATLVTSHTVTVTGLTAGTLYHFQVRSAQGANVTLSIDFRAVTVIPRPTSVSIS